METKQHATSTTNAPMEKSKRKSEKWKTTFQNLWNTAEAVLKEKFTAIQGYFKKQEKSQINNITLYLKELGKEQTKQKLVEGRK